MEMAAEQVLGWKDKTGEDDASVDVRAEASGATLGLTIAHRCCAASHRAGRLGQVVSPGCRRCRESLKRTAK